MKLRGAWTYLGCSTYEAITGDRIHILGLIRHKGKDIQVCDKEFNDLYYLCLKIMGFNNKRALMLTCERLSFDG